MSKKKRDYRKMPMKDVYVLQEEFVKWVDKFWLDSGATKLPSFRQAAEQFNLYIKDIETLATDCELMHNIGFGNRGGYWVEPHIGDFTIEPSCDASEKFWNKYYGRSK
jgi:hypothetical protein